MKTFLILILLVSCPFILLAQLPVSAVDLALKNLRNDSQAKHATIAFYVVNSKSGKVLYDYNGQTGVAAASSQKVLTSIAALELLTPEYRYKTQVSINAPVVSGTLNGNLTLTGSGDPTFGSWRYNGTKEDVVLKKISAAVKSAGITRIQGKIVADAGLWESQSVPGGWIWDDIGNYYGAGVTAINWRENQYDLKLKPGAKEGDPAGVLTTVPLLYNVSLQSELKTGKRGSGDQGIIYLAPNSTTGVVRGSIPLGEDPFTISGSIPNPSLQLRQTIFTNLVNSGIGIDSSASTKQSSTTSATSLLLHTSPPLDSINYWFLKRSINLYGEALVKTISAEKTGFGSTDSGLAVIKRFWSTKGIDTDELGMLDGSGLSPQNRFTAHALATAMQYARSQSYFAKFYNALPEINGLHMKSGSIGGARSFTGYVNGKTGDYTFAIIINGYNGSSAAMVRKLYALLDVLK